jgi:hypothetical protein
MALKSLRQPGSISRFQKHFAETPLAHDWSRFDPHYGTGRGAPRGGIVCIRHVRRVQKLLEIAQFRRLLSKFGIHRTKIVVELGFGNPPVANGAILKLAPLP